MKKPSTNGIKPALTFQGTPLYRAEQAGKMLEPPVSDRRMRSLADTYGKGLVFGRTLFFTLDDLRAIQLKRKIGRRRKGSVSTASE